jgi:hypothetical protein
MFLLIAQQTTTAITNPAISANFGTGADTPSAALASIIVTIWRAAITLGGLALIVMLIMGALEWITAGGEKAKVQAARDRITQSVIGMMVLAGTVAISVFISGILGINLLQPNFADNVTGGNGGTLQNALGPVTPGGRGGGGTP